MNESLLHSGPQQTFIHAVGTATRVPNVTADAAIFTAHQRGDFVVAGGHKVTALSRDRTGMSVCRGMVTV
jgi:hypothetical protein